MKTEKQYHKRKYVPVNPSKYKGDPTCIIMRSSWETKFAIWCDHNPSILEWTSESIVIPYQCPTDNKMHRYFVDFSIKVKDKHNNIKSYLIEIKPENQTIEPVYNSRSSKESYYKKVMTWGKNQAKWNAAKEYCKARGSDFMILTEKHLGI